jgi:hypothetical protein
MVMAGVPKSEWNGMCLLQSKLDEALKRIANDEKRVSQYLASVWKW